MSKTKWFHISDVLSVYTGVIIADSTVMKKPDGTIRDPAGNDMAGYLDLIEHLTAISFRRTNKDKQTFFDRSLHDHMIGLINKTLSEQLTWLQYVEYNENDFIGFDDAAEKRRKDFIEGLTAQYGEWHEVTQDKFNLVPIQKQAPRSDLPGISLN